MSTTGPTNFGSAVNVIFTQSSAMARDDASGSHASRPNAYQLAWLKVDPDQSRSVPMFDTPAMPVSLLPNSEPSITRSTVEPGPLAWVSDCSTSSHIGPR